MIIQLDQVIPLPLELEVSKGLTQIFGKNIHFDVSKRNLIIAASGKGKSTLLNILFGLRRDFDGFISIDNKSIEQFTHDNWSDFRKDKVGYIFQDLRLLGNLTVFENIQLKNQLTNHKSLIEIDSMLQKLGVFEIKNQKVDTLSYGQKQRVAIIRSLCQPLQFLFMDEPFSHLDTQNIDLSKNMIINELDSQKAGCLMVSLGDDYGISFDKVYDL